MKTFFQTPDFFSLFLLRVTLGLVFFPHGAQKALGLFGGLGFSGTMHTFTTAGMPWVLGFLVIVGEFLGSLALLAGFLTRFAAFGIFSIMVGAIALVHGYNGFFMNWFNNPKAQEGYEYHLLVIGMSLTLLIAGAGKWSMDRGIADKLMD